MRAALRCLVGVGWMWGAVAGGLAFIDPLSLPTPRVGSATPRVHFSPSAVPYRLRGGQPAGCAAGDGGGDSIPERLAAVRAKIKHACQANGAWIMLV